jgi:hypothetical protein
METQTRALSPRVPPGVCPPPRNQAVTAAAGACTRKYPGLPRAPAHLTRVRWSCYTGGMLTSRYTRTVSLRRAHASRALFVLMAVAGVLCFAFELVTGHPAFLVAPAVCGGIRARRWTRAIRRSRTAPDEMRWTP